MTQKFAISDKVKIKFKYNSTEYEAFIVGMYSFNRVNVKIPLACVPSFILTDAEAEKIRGKKFGFTEIEEISTFKSQ